VVVALPVIVIVVVRTVTQVAQETKIRHNHRQTANHGDHQIQLIQRADLITLANAQKDENGRGILNEKHAHFKKDNAPAQGAGGHLLLLLSLKNVVSGPPPRGHGQERGAQQDAAKNGLLVLHKKLNAKEEGNVLYSSGSFRSNVVAVVVLMIGGYSSSRSPEEDPAPATSVTTRALVNRVTRISKTMCCRAKSRGKERQ